MLKKHIVFDLGKIPKKVLIGSYSNGFIHQNTKDVIYMRNLYFLVLSMLSTLLHKESLDAGYDHPAELRTKCFQAGETVLEQFSTLIIALATRLGPLHVNKERKNMMRFNQVILPQ